MYRDGDRANITFRTVQGEITTILARYSEEYGCFITISGDMLTAAQILNIKPVK